MIQTRFFSCALAAALVLSCLGCTASRVTEEPTTSDTTSSAPAETTAARTETTTPAPTETAPPEPSVPPKRVALTFDDGPAFDLGTLSCPTCRLVDKLAQVGGRATFFLVGNRITDASAHAVTYAASHGCEIGIHAYTHEYDFSTCRESTFLSELTRTRDRIEEILGTPVTLFRPPYGAITDERAALSGYPIILWSLDSEDWRHKSRKTAADAAQNVRTIVDTVLASVRDGDIILMHDIYQNTYEAAVLIIDELTAQGYALVTVSELIGRDALHAGERYLSGT